MGTINLNLTDGDVLVPEGEHPVTVGDVIVRRRSGVMGDLYLSWHLSIDEGPHAGQGLWMISSLRSDMLRMLGRSFVRSVSQTKGSPLNGVPKTSEAPPS